PVEASPLPWVHGSRPSMHHGDYRAPLPVWREGGLIGRFPALRPSKSSSLSASKRNSRMEVRFTVSFSIQCSTPFGIQEEPTGVHVAGGEDARPRGCAHLAERRQ